MKTQLLPAVFCILQLAVCNYQANAQSLYRISDIIPGSAGAYEFGTTLFKGEIYFSVDNSVNGSEFWKTDGTMGGTLLVKDINPGGAPSYSGSFTPISNTLFFSADDGTNGKELWKSDGTATGTVMIKNINAGSTSSVGSVLKNINGTLFFTSYIGGELWKSDGTAAGTTIIKDLYPGFSTGPNYDVTNIFDFNGTAFFTSPKDATNGNELWKSDGTAGGTVMVKDINPGTNSSTPGSFIIANNTLFFRCDDGINGNELWKTDGTSSGTVMVKDINPGTASSFPSNIKVINNILYFSAKPDTTMSLWKSDGTAAGTVKIKDFKSLDNFINFNDTLVFSGNDSINGTELWKSDGTAAGTVMIKDINAGAGSSREYPAYSQEVLSNMLYFVAFDSINGYEIWKTDGSATGTVKISTFSNDTIAWSEPRFFLAVGDSVIYFSVDDGVYGREMWVLNKSGITLLPQIKEDFFSVTVYPNPFSTTTILTFYNAIANGSEIRNFSISFYNLLGKEVTVNSIRNSDSFIIDRNNLPTGIYLCQLKSGNDIIAKTKIIIQ